MSMKPKYDVKDMVIASRFRIQQYIGGGSFGEIFKGVRISNNEPVAIKMELSQSKCPQLKFELKLYQAVNPNNDAIGIPSIHWYGVEAEYNCLVMDVLGPSLENLHSYCGRRFSFKTTMILAAQMLNRLEYLHSQGFIHRDIKPDNFLMGTGATSHIVYMIDFGLAKRYTCAKTSNHIPFRDGKSLTGTARYCSIDTHCGIEQSRRDDLEAIGYMLVYFLKGRLPWQELPPNANKQQRYDRIMEKKMSVTPEQLCAGISQPEVLSFVRYCRALGFSDQLDYVGWRRIFLEALRSEQLRFDYNYDWVAVGRGQPFSVAQGPQLSGPPVGIGGVMSPLVSMTKASRRRLQLVNAGGTIIDVTPLQPDILVANPCTVDNSKNSNLTYGSMLQTNNANYYAYADSSVRSTRQQGGLDCSSVDSSFTGVNSSNRDGQRGTTVADTRLATLGGCESRRDSATDVCSTNLAVGREGPSNADPSGQVPCRYVAVAVPGRCLNWASNVFHCRFMPCEPFVIPRLASSPTYYSSSSDGE